MRHLKLSQIDQFTRKELKKAVENCFEYAPEASPVDRLAILQEAQFYTRELERRSDSWVSIRDLILELVVIGMIGWEIRMGYRQEADQIKEFGQQQQIFQNLETSSEATAKTLNTLESTTETMSGAIQHELALFYDVSLIPMWDDSSKRITFTNSGRTNVALWGAKVWDGEPLIGTEPRIIAQSSSYSLSLSDVHESILRRIPKGSNMLVPLELYVKNERQEEFVMHCYFAINWENDMPVTRMQVGSVVPERWPVRPSAKANVPAFGTAPSTSQ